MCSTRARRARTSCPVHVPDDSKGIPESGSYVGHPTWHLDPLHEIKKQSGINFLVFSVMMTILDPILYKENQLTELFQIFKSLIYSEG